MNSTTIILLLAVFLMCVLSGCSRSHTMNYDLYHTTQHGEYRCYQIVNDVQCYKQGR